MDMKGLIKPNESHLAGSPEQPKSTHSVAWKYEGAYCGNCGRPMNDHAEHCPMIERFLKNVKVVPDGN